MNIKSVLITGGTGSFGQHFIQYLLKKYKRIKRIVIFSRDELKQFEMQKTYPKKKYYAILNPLNKKVMDYYNKKVKKKFPSNFSYNSLDNKDYLGVKQLKKLIDLEIKKKNFF